MSGSNQSTPYSSFGAPLDLGTSGEIIDLSGGDYVPAASVKAIIVVAVGNVICRPLNANADITITGAPVGFVLPWYCSKIESSGTTATLATVTDAGAVDPPVWTEPPYVEPGEVRVGVSLILNTGTYEGGAINGIEWLLDGVPIAGANTGTYTPIAGDVDGYLSVWVELAGEGGAASLVTAPVGPVLPDEVPEPVHVLVANATQNSGATSTTSRLTFSYTVPLGQKQKLVVFATTANGNNDQQSFTAATFGGEAMTLLMGNTPNSSGTRWVTGAIYVLDNPPTGTANIEIDRAASTSTRWNIHAVTLQNCAEELVDIASYWNATGATSYDFAPPAEAGVAGQRALVCAISMTESANPTYALTGGYSTLGSAVAPGGAGIVSIVGTCEVDEAGPVPAGLGVGASPGRNVLMFQLIAAPEAGEGELGTYYVANEGDDSNSGLTFEQAWKSLDKLSAITFGPGSQIVLEDGQYHRFSVRPSYGTHALLLNSNGDAENPVVVRTRNGGRAYIAGDEIKTGWLAASSNETNNVATALDAEKITLGDFSTYHQLSFPCLGDFMLQPASWCAGGYPSSIYDWDLQTPGTDSFTFVDGANVQIGTGNPPPTDFESGRTVQCKAVAEGGRYRWTVRITDPAITEHYGAISPVGAILYLKSYNVQTQIWPITAYDQGGSWIETEYLGDSNWGPHNFRFFWAILCHPYDLRRRGQFARIGTDLFAAWPVGGGTVKSVAATDRVMRLIGEHCHMRDIEVCRAASDSGGSGTESVFEVNGSGHELTDVGVTQAINPSRPPAFGVMLSTGLTNTNFIRPYTRQVRHHSGLRFGYASDLSIVEPDLQELGRTGIYLGGSSHNISVTDLIIPQHSPVHGNGISSYMQSRDLRVDGALIADADNCWTAQIKPGPNHPSPPGKANLLEHFVFGGMRSIAPSPAASSALYLLRIDQGDRDCIYRDGLGWFSGSATMTINWEQNEGWDNAGARVERAALQSLVFGRVAAGADVTIQDVRVNTSVYGGTGTGGAQPWDSWGGATLNNAAINATAEPYPISDAAWAVLTADGGVKRIGPAKLGWTIPEYGGPITITNLLLVAPIIREGWQPYRTVGFVAGAMPLSSLSLLAGAGDSDDFELDRGYLVTKHALALGSYSVTVRETNASAVNGPTRDTVLTIEVVP